MMTIKRYPQWIGDILILDLYFNLEVFITLKNGGDGGHRPRV